LGRRKTEERRQHKIRQVQSLDQAGRLPYVSHSSSYWDLGRDSKTLSAVAPNDAKGTVRPEEQGPGTESTEQLRLQMVVQPVFGGRGKRASGGVEG
jgi:hypothetical protein